MREWMNSWSWKGWLLAAAIVLYSGYGLYGLLSESDADRYERRSESGDAPYSR